MHVSWILLASVGVGLVLLFVYALCRMASEQDRAARHSEKKFFPHSEVTITWSPFVEAGRKPNAL